MLVQLEDIIPKPFVSVVIITYNQQNTIVQAIESVMAQQCNFNFEIVIGEDCGADLTRSICIEYQKKYPKVIKLILQDFNKGVSNNYVDCINTCRGEFIAQCAGDDFWIDEFKLQKQVDFLKCNDRYALVHTSYEVLKSSDKSCYFDSNVIEIDTSFESLLLSNKILALTCCFRKSVFELYVEDVNPLERGWLMEDYPFWLWISSRYKIKFFNDITAVYRISQNSLSNMSDPIKKYLFEISVNEIREYYAIKENKLSLIKESLGEFYFELLQMFYIHSYFGKEIDLLNIKIKLYKRLNYLNKIRLWGLGGIKKYKFSNFLIKTYHNFKGYAYNTNNIRN